MSETKPTVYDTAVAEIARGAKTLLEAVSPEGFMAAEGISPVAGVALVLASSLHQATARPAPPPEAARPAGPSSLLPPGSFGFGGFGVHPAFGPPSAAGPAQDLRSSLERAIAVANTFGKGVCVFVEDREYHVTPGDTVDEAIARSRRAT